MIFFFSKTAFLRGKWACWFRLQMQRVPTIQKKRIKKNGNLFHNRLPPRHNIIECVAPITYAS